MFANLVQQGFDKSLSNNKFFLNTLMIAITFFFQGNNTYIFDVTINKTARI